MAEDKQFLYPDTGYGERFTADYAKKITKYLQTDCGLVLLCAFCELLWAEMQALFCIEENLSVADCYEQAFTRVSPTNLSRQILKACKDYGFASSNIDLIQTNELALILKFENSRIVRCRIRDIFYATRGQECPRCSKMRCDRDDGSRR